MMVSEKHQQRKKPINTLVINFGLPVLVMQFYGFIPGCYDTWKKTIKETPNTIQPPLEVFSMFKISIWYDNYDVVEGLGIKYIN